MATNGGKNQAQVSSGSINYSPSLWSAAAAVVTDPECVGVAPGEGACPHTCSSIEANCTQTCESSGDYGDCSLQTPVVRDCVVHHEMGHCLPATQTSAANHACAPPNSSV